MAWKALAALAIAVGGAVAAFAVYTFGWHDSATRTVTTTTAKRDPYVKTVRDAAGLVKRVYTLRDGDIVLRPEAAAQCAAYAEGGFPNLFCKHASGRGRHQVIFYEDSVLVWPLDCPTCGPDGPVHSYKWAPKIAR